MKRIKRRTFSGVVCEQIVHCVSDRVQDIQKAKPRIRFKTEKEREIHKMKISRQRHVRAFNENFSPDSLYSTLTFDDENEVHTFKEAKRIEDNFLRRLLYAYPKAVIFFYKGRGKHTNRIHFHMVSQGIPAEYIKKQWFYGSVLRIDNLRAHNYYNGIDHGQDYTGLANYLFDHWTPEQGGHHWRQTKTARKPDQEPATECKRVYTVEKPPKAPKGYLLVEARATEYGYLYFKYIKQPPKVTRSGRKKPIPNRLD